MESRLSSHEVDYIVEGIENDLREDGRSNCDYRHVQLQTGVLANTNGSAKLTLVSLKKIDSTLLPNTVVWNENSRWNQSRIDRTECVKSRSRNH